jgi:transglutaminase-like putative cysteine protease
VPENASIRPGHANTGSSQQGTTGGFCGAEVRARNPNRRITKFGDRQRPMESTMRGSGFGTIMAVAALLSLSPKAPAQRQAPELAVSDPRVYDVTITTTFVVPAAETKLSTLRVWHGLPTARPWDGLDRTLGASAITYRPETGRVQYLAHNDSQHVFWECREGLEAGKRFEFVSSFRVRSADRTFDPKKAVAKWSDYPVYEAPRVIDAKLAALADEIKARHAPAEAALEFCKWITSHIRYDASVPYGAADLAAILTYEKGHCGHQMAVFEALCGRAGIPTRTVWGMNLYAAEGVGQLHKIRPDFENRHTWAQIYLPGSGWVEIDPGAGPKAYSLPGQLIQNSTDFQNYVIWVEEDGQWKQPSWEYRDGKWHSPYGVENLITFRVQPR